MKGVLIMPNDTQRAFVKAVVVFTISAIVGFGLSVLIGSTL